MKRDRECGTKVRYKTKVGACIAADKALDVGMNVYQCSKCGHWHIGKARSPMRSSDRIGALLHRHERRLAARANAGVTAPERKSEGS